MIIVFIVMLLTTWFTQNENISDVVCCRNNTNNYDKEGKNCDVMSSILLVDDDEGILEVFQILLKRAGYQVTIFNKGESIYNNQFEEPDLFILDRHISGVDGLELCRFLKHRQENSHTPVIIFTASSHTKAQAKEAGADDFIEKPFNSKELIAMIENHLKKPVV